MGLWICPICERDKFSRKKLVQHMRQPTSKCHSGLHPSVLHAAERTAGSWPTAGPADEESDDDVMDVDEDVDEDDGYGFDPDDDTPMAGPDDEPIPGPFKESFEGAAEIISKGGDTFMDSFRRDPLSKHREGNVYFPFASALEWELVSFFNSSGLSMAQIDTFLKLGLVAQMNLSFKTAKEMRSRIELLPKGPQWKFMRWLTEFPTKRPLYLFYRDPLECLEALLSNPLVADFIEFTPFKLWENAGKLMRVYTEWLSGNAAWDTQAMQQKLAPGATVVGGVISTDKTQLTTMTGNRTAYPALISCANIVADFRMKASHHAFMLFALLPVAKFVEQNPKIRGVLESRIYHAIMDFVLKPLKTAAEIGRIMADPVGNLRLCHTPLAALIVDTPEACMAAGVAGLTSPVTTASYLNFGDAYKHPPRNRQHTLSRLERLEKSGLDPWDDLAEYIKEAKKLRLNGVHRPFWHNWKLSDPSVFLTPEILHHWLKFFFDHPIKWCITVLGAAEIDFRFGLLRPHAGMRHFTNGISKAKQLTGRDHREMMRYIVALIEGAVSLGFLQAIANLNAFFYRGQAPMLREDDLRQMDRELLTFHQSKQHILDAGARKGKKGKVKHWYIPKMEFLQSVVPAVRLNGVPLQWTADVTERGHISEVKDPAAHTNNQSYESQIVRNLDRRDKCRNFTLATAMATAGVDMGDPPVVCDDDDDTEDALGDDTPLLLNRSSKLLEKLQPIVRISGPRSAVNYFAQSVSLAEKPDALRPLRTFTSADESTAFHLKRDPHARLKLNDAAVEFDLPDLQNALYSFIHRSEQEGTGPDVKTADEPASQPSANARRMVEI
ncbi:hypothetical protein DFH06DRAFT_1141333 [Mycena polygramma]|nr:hypothetical protein DFH06DRAFT_1141333 [Mycena polygramma]